MSIIHDALKKVQQGQAQKPDETPTAPATPPTTSGYIYSTPEEPTPADEMPVEHLTGKQNKAKSVIAFICALAFTLGSLLYCYKQLNACIPNFKNLVVSSFDKLIHKKKQPDLKPQAPAALPPLAKITVNQPKVAPILTSAPTPTNTSPSLANTASLTKLPTPTNVPANPDTFKLNGPETLNIHGVMSNGSSNVVLIDDQVYQEGDEVDGVKIIKIRLDSITVDNNGKEETIRVKS